MGCCCCCCVSSVHWHMHWVRFGIRMCVRVCVRRGGLSERSSGVVLVVSQINRDDGVSVCVVGGREMRRGKREEGEEMRGGGVCQLDV